MLDGDEQVISFWKDPERPQGKTLLMIGEGFDPRMNNVLSAFTEAHIEFSCLIIVHGDRTQSPNKEMVEKNVAFRDKILSEKAIPYTVYNLKVGERYDLNRGVKFLNKEIDGLIDGFDNIVVDISALPRVLYFNVVRALYNMEDNRNLFVVVSENAEIDKNIKYRNFVDDMEPMVNFNPGIGLEAEQERLRLLITLLGENGMEKLKMIMKNFKPDEVFPVIPYPSLDPFRTDSIIKEYQDLFKQEDAKDNIIYAHERNPFELYKMLSRFIKSEDDILDKVGREACYGIALLSSKLLSVGALLTALENQKEVAIYNVISRDYGIEPMDFDETNKKSSTFLMWIKGDAYSAA